MLARLLICLLSICFGTSVLHAQWQWVDNSEGSSGVECVSGVAVDDARGVIYSVGALKGGANFPEIPNASLYGAEDGFVMKYDTLGNVLWAFVIGGTNNDRITGVDVDTNTGNIFISGYILGNTANLSGTSGGAPGNVSGVTGQDGFVASYNEQGQLLWYKIIGGSGFDGALDVTVNEYGVYVLGYYTNTGLLSSLLSVVLPIGGELNNFVMCFNKTTGSFLWDAILTSTVDDYQVPGSNDEISRMGICSDENNIYLVTQKGGDTYRIRQGSGSVAETLTNPGADFVVTSYSNAGAHNWSVLYDNNDALLFGLDITNDCSGVYVSGNIHNNGSTPGGTIINSVHDDYILSKLEKTNGTELWVKEFNSIYNHDDYFIGLDADGYGNIYAVGRLRGTATSLNAQFSYTSGPSDDKIMIAHFNSNGAFKSFEVYNSSDDSWASGVGTYKNEKYVVGGFYNGTLSFNGVAVSSNSGDNAFVALRNLDAPISYVSESGNAIFCQDEANPIPTTNVIAGGVFSGPSEVVFVSTSTGEIDLSSSTVGGPYTITYGGAPLNCSNESFSVEIVIAAVDDPSFAYTKTDFCENEPNPIPSSIASPGGTFSTSSAVIVNPTTGEVDVSASPTGGPYYIVYTTNNALCPRQDSVAVYIRAVPDPSFAYAQTMYCEGTGTIFPSSISQTGGVFSGPSEIVFANSSTGEIDLTASSAGGPYTIQYQITNAYCEDSTTFDISISPVEDPTFTYAETHFCKNESNPIAASISYPGGVFSNLTGLVIVDSGTGEIDVMGSTTGAHELIYTTSASMCAQSDTLEVFVEDAPDPSFSYAQSSYCYGTGTVLPNFVATAGGIFTAPSEIVFVNSSTGEIDLTASTVGGPYTIQYWVPNTYCQDSTTFSFTILPEDDASFSLTSTYFCNNEVNPVAASIATPGGTFSATMGVVIANTTTGEIDVANSTPGGPFYLVYTTAGVCPTSDSLDFSIAVAPDPSFAYPHTLFCSNEGTALPSSVTTAGGTFSGPSGVIIDPLTGEIDLAASISGGPFSIQYHVETANCEDSTIFDITINPADDASFAYAGSHFCNNEPNVVPSSVTTPGGSFTASVGVVVDATTGEIDVVNSQLGGPYWVYYTTNASVCPSVDSVEIYIEAAPNPSFSYAQANFCITGGIVAPNYVATLGGTFSGPSEISFTNTQTGEIDLNACTAGGPYTIQYLVSNAYCQKTSTVTVTIVDQDDLTSVDYAANAFCISDENQYPVINGVSGGVFSADASIALADFTTGEIVPTASTPGGPYTMKYVTPGMCPDSVEWEIYFNAEPTSYAGIDQELFFRTKASLNADAPTLGAGEWWSDSGVLIDDSMDPKSDVSNLNVGENTFIWTVSDGVCPAVSDEVVIHIRDLYIPQAVTPNDDGKNDYFELRSLDEVTCDLKIFNRWGQIVYENTDYQNEWYGLNSNGNQLENDTYFYVILIDGYLEYNGYVVLKK